MKKNRISQLSHCLVTLSTFLLTLTLQIEAFAAVPPNAAAQVQLVPINSQRSSIEKTTARPHIQSQAPSPISATATSSSNPPTSATTSTPTTSTTTATSTIVHHHHTSQPPEKTWLESILIQVEEGLNHQQQQQQRHESLLATSEEDDEGSQSVVQGQAVSSSLAPTDSGEDPLESTTTLAETLANTGSGSNLSITELRGSISGDTRYSIATSVSSDPDSVSLEEQQLVDSNNVSAVVAEQPPPETRNHWQPQTATGEPLSLGPKQVMGCDQAYTQCALRKVCAPALRAYNDDCQELINNRTSQCSAKCLKAMIALRSSEEGDDLVNCDCQGNEYCLQSKQRGQTCRPQVEQAVDPKTVVSCSTASWICLADQLCSTALDYYYRNCQSLFSQRHCSLRCNNSLSILYRQPKASKLINCHCDGSEEFPCVKYKTYTERLCLNKLPPTTQTAASSSDLLFGEEEQQQQLKDNNDNNNNHEHQPAADDGFNMTNDPETFILGSPTSSGNYNDEDEYEDAKAAASGGGSVSGEGGGGGGSEESTSVLNGIQMVEDNWIPLMSGRYFTNLHQQQMRQQQQKQVKHKQQQQVASSSSSSSAAAQRKSQKNVKQKSKSNNTNGHHHDSRRRYNRLLMFASTSSSATHINQPSSSLLTIWTTTCLVLFLNLVVYPLGPHT